MDSDVRVKRVKSSRFAVVVHLFANGFQKTLKVVRASVTHSAARRVPLSQLDVI